MELLREITPLTQNDCFTLFSRHKETFDFPLHTHEEFELNLILQAAGARRVVGDHIEHIDDMELVFVGPNLPHAWFTGQCASKNIHEVTIQFHKDLMDDNFLHKRQLSFLRTMFEKAACGLAFSRETIERISPRIIALVNKTGFSSVLELLVILHELSISSGTRTLCAGSYQQHPVAYSCERVDKVMAYLNNNFQKDVALADAATIVNMTQVSFSRFFKAKTGHTFMDTLSDIRLGHATRLLIETSQGIAEIGYDCGFNNISNFNRIFKKRKGCTPMAFRNDFSGTRIFV